MIVVTGPGRSGTSLVAALYRELGFDPGGGWFERVNAGLEHPEVVRLNDQIAADLGVTMLNPPLEMPASVRQAARRFIPASRQVWARNMARRAAVRLGYGQRNSPSFLEWPKFDTTVERHREAAVRLSRELAVAKDPRFCWTLGVWAACGATIDHVLLTLRSLDAMVASRLSAGHVQALSPDGARNAFAYGVGLCVTAVIDHGVPFDIVRFPQFVRDPDALFRAMRFPAPVERDRFDEAFTKVARHDLVHEWG